MLMTDTGKTYPHSPLEACGFVHMTLNVAGHLEGALLHALTLSMLTWSLCFLPEGHCPDSHDLSPECLVLRSGLSRPPSSPAFWKHAPLHKHYEMLRDP